MAHDCDETGCGSQADWVRCTQFSGDHFFCENHARLEANFGQRDDSYFYWMEIQEYRQFPRQIASDHVRRPHEPAKKETMVQPGNHPESVPCCPCREAYKTSFQASSDRARDADDRVMWREKEIEALVQDIARLRDRLRRLESALGWRDRYPSCEFHSCQACDEVEKILEEKA